MEAWRRPLSPCPSSRPSSPGSPPCELQRDVGIEAVLDQLKIKAMKMGFEFNIMVVGQSGLGKSTMMNTLFKSKVWRTPLTGVEMTTAQTLKLQSMTHLIEEKGVKLRLTVTDTPGFGDQINNDKCWEPILGYIHQQYEQYLQEELLITRQRHIPDTRVHCCIYFVPPTGHCLRPLDIEFLQRLCRTVNVVPVIARADSLTLEERDSFRRRIQQNLQTYRIEVYPQKCLDEDFNDKILNSKIRERIPFAVVGADREHMVNGKCVLGRKTRWGIIEVENMAHCEFPLLRDLLIRSHFQDLKDITHNVHYENYRVCRLNESHLLPRGPGWVNLTPPAQDSPGASPGTSPGASPAVSHYAPARAPARTLSRAPSRSSSLAPARVPSRSPSCSPSHSPTRALSLTPDRVPSRSPSRSLSRSPPLVSSHAPSRAPSRTPSRAPSRTPSRAPSRAHSHPSSRPTSPRTARPTKPRVRAPTGAPMESEEDEF